MRCHQCSHDNAQESRFCGECGAPLSGRLPVESESESTLVLRPEFVPKAALLAAMPLQIFLTIWGGGFFGGFSQLVIDGLDLSVPRWVPFPVFGALFFFGIALFFYHAQRRSYEKTQYRFTKFKLDYYQGFLTVAEDTVPLANVAEVSLRRGLVQKRFGLGTIILSTPVSITSSRDLSGIRLHDLKDPEEAYERVKELVEGAHRGNTRRAEAAA